MSCGGNNSQKDEEIIMKPNSLEVTGDMEGCFTVVDKEYKVNGDWTKKIIIEIERTEKELPFELGDRELRGYGVGGWPAAVYVGFGIEFLDEDGNILDKTEANSTPYDYEEPKTLVNLKPNGRGSITFSIYSDAEKATQFRITSTFREKEEEEPIEVTTTENDATDDTDSAIEDVEKEETSTSSSSNDFDEVLDSYEEYVDKYISYMKKAQNGDMSALAEYPALLKKAQELNKKIENSKGEMTTAQITRYTQITTKMASAMQ